MFKVNKRNTIIRCELWTYFTPCSSVSITNFEQVNTGWVRAWKPAYSLNSILFQLKLMYLITSNQITDKKYWTMKSFTGFQTLKFSSGFVKCIFEYCSGNGGGNGYHPWLSTLREKCPKTELFRSVFSRTRNECGKIRTIKNSVFEHFLRSGIYNFKSFDIFVSRKLNFFC